MVVEASLRFRQSVLLYSSMGAETKAKRKRRSVTCHPVELFRRLDGHRKRWVSRVEVSQSN